VSRSDEDFVAFVRERGTSLLRLATLLAGNRHSGEDLFQSAVERTYARWSRAGSIQDLDAYIRQVIVRGARRQWRRRLRQPETLVATAPETAIPGGQGDVVARAALLQALALLTRQQKAVIVLRYFADQSEAQVASLLGCSVGTVKAHASRGLERLRVHPMAISALDTSEEC
jgi:RNA polymerase sigma-70 factor (sigma-E family)